MWFEGKGWQHEEVLCKGGWYGTSLLMKKWFFNDYKLDGVCEIEVEEKGVFEAHLI